MDGLPVTDLAVLIPVLDRPHRVAPLVASLTASLAGPCRIVFLCSPSDHAEIAAVTEEGLEPTVADWEPGRGDYAKKMNLGWRTTDEEWVLLAADDLFFRPGWFDAAMRVYADLRPCVIGTNDLGNPKVMAGLHSTHTLIHRDYGECGTVDDPARICHEGYWHNWVDNELVETAMARRTFMFAPDAHVEHLHPIWRKNADDATYARGQEHYAADRDLFNRRRRLWHRREL